MKNFLCLSNLSSARTSRSSSARLAYPIAILLTLAAFASPSQSRPIDFPAGSVHGTINVISPDGQSYGAPGAQVRLIGATRDALQLAIADDSGQYRFGSVRPGSYQLEVALDGFEKVTRPLTIHASEAISENVNLVVKGVREEGSTKAERVGLNLKDAEFSAEIRQPASSTDPVVSERLRDAVLLSMKGSRASRSGLTVNSIAASYNTFNPNSARHFLSTPDRMVHVPKLSSPEIQVLKGLSLSVSPRVSLKNPSHSRRSQFPDVQGSYPRDFQGNLANSRFGVLSSGVGRIFGMRFVIEKK
jgi:hypothetical protein